MFDAMPGALFSGDSVGGGIVQSPRTGYSAVPASDADLYLTAEGMQRTATAYLAGHDPRDPRVSPVFGTLAPHVRVDVGTAEILLEDARRLADRAEVHVFPGNVGALRAADLALDGIAEFLRAHRAQ